MATATVPVEGEFVNENEEREPARQPAAMVRYDPSQLLGMAIEKGMDIATLEKLMDLQERWEKNQAKREFFAARARFQAIVPEIPKQKQGYGYYYADLGIIERAIAESLGECGLSKAWSQVEAGDEITMTCTATHIAGHSESNTIGPVKWDLLERTNRMNGLQHRSAVITMLQRYTLIGVLGLATADEDIDAQNGEGKKKKKEEKPEETRVADQIRQPRVISGPQGKELGKITEARKIPPDAIAKIIQSFGFEKGTEITVDKFGEIKAALNAWVPREPGAAPKEDPKTVELREKARRLFIVACEAGKALEAGDAVEKAAGVREIAHVAPGEIAAVIAGLESLKKTGKK